MRYLKICYIFFAAIFNAACVFAEEPELITDRPDFTESAVVVPYRSLQVKTGYEYSKDLNSHTMTIPNALMRIGLLPFAEMRFGVSGWSWSNSGGKRSYFNDFSLETKIQFGERESAQPMALILFATIPAATKAISSGESDFGLKLAFATDLTESSSLGINAGGASLGTENDRLYSVCYSASYGRALNERMGFFVEHYSEMPEHSAWLPVLDGGLTFSPGALYQFDLYAGLGLNDPAPDFIWGAGFCSRW